MRALRLIYFIAVLGCTSKETSKISYDDFKLNTSFIDSLRNQSISEDTVKVNKFQVSWHETLYLPDSVTANIQYDSLFNITALSLKRGQEIIFSETYWHNGNPRIVVPNLLDNKTEVKDMILFYPTGETAMVGFMKDWRLFGKCTYYSKSGKVDSVVTFPRTIKK